MDVPYLCTHALQGISTLLEDTYYDIETNTHDTKVQEELDSSQFLCIYGFISVLIFFTLLALMNAFYYYLKTCYQKCRDYEVEEISGRYSSLSERSSPILSISTSISDRDTFTESSTSRESSFDSSTVASSNFELYLSRNKNTDVNFSTESVSETDFSRAAISDDISRTWSSSISNNVTTASEAHFPGDRSINNRIFNDKNFKLLPESGSCETLPSEDNVSQTSILEGDISSVSSWECGTSSFSSSEVDISQSYVSELDVSSLSLTDDDVSIDN